jgi:hypothetical protein
MVSSQTFPAAERANAKLRWSIACAATAWPAAMRRFAMLACYGKVRPARLPVALRDKI